MVVASSNFSWTAWGGGVPAAFFEACYFALGCDLAPTQVLAKELLPQTFVLSQRYAQLLVPLCAVHCFCGDCWYIKRLFTPAQ